MTNRSITLDDLFAKAWSQHWNKPRFLASGWAMEAKRSWERLIAPNFGQSSLRGLTAGKIRAWHDDLSATPTQANRALAVLSKMFSFAQERELHPQGANPCRLVKPHRERRRRRFASPEEIAKIGAILEREAHHQPRAVAFIYILMFSGARPRSIERATWGDLAMVQHEGQSFGVLIFDGKSTAATGESEQVVIPPQAMTLLKKEQNPAKPLLGIKMPRNFWASVRKEAGCEDLWARDWRRTFATVGLSNGVSAGVIGELLNHHSAETTKIYLQLLHSKKMAAVKAIADQMSLMIKEGKQNGG